MQRTYRTPKGTDLPLLNLRGREYLEVKYRLVWFREDHPDWAIETDLLSVTEMSAYARATIKDQHGRIIATSHKFETKKGFPDFIEKAETGAIGRALALIGYGTQFCADELDEGSRIVDAPVEAYPRTAPREAYFDADGGGRDEPSRKDSLQAKKPSDSAGDSQAAQSIPKDPGEYQIMFGKKYKGLKLRDIARPELEGYLEWLEENATKKGLPLSEEARFLKVAVDRYLQNASGQSASSASGQNAQGAQAAGANNASAGSQATSGASSGGATASARPQANSSANAAKGPQANAGQNTASSNANSGAKSAKSQASPNKVREPAF